MTDKTRAEFEEVFPLPEFCRWEQDSYCWVRTRTEHPHNTLWQAWLAAKEKYDPSIKACYYAVVDGRFIQQDTRSGQLEIYETEAEAKAACPPSCEVIEIVASKAVSAPSTQGGGE